MKSFDSFTGARRRGRGLRAVCAAVAAFGSMAPALAQSNGVPLSTAQAAAEKTTRERGVKQVIDGTPAVIKGVSAAVASGTAGGAAAMGKINGLAEFLGTVQALEGVVDATVKEGPTGFMREGTQAVFDKAAERITIGTGQMLATEVGVVGATGVAVSAGIGLAAAGGIAAGTYIRNNTPIGRAVDNTAFRFAPDGFKEAISGTEQYHPDSIEAKAREVVETQRLRRQNAFNRELGDNRAALQETQRQIARERAALDAEYPSRDRPAEQRSAELLQPAMDSMKQLTTTLQAQQQQRNLAEMQARQQAAQAPRPGSTPPAPAKAPSGRSTCSGNICW